ncbi:hypothetical protein FBZ84_101193 [Azospirillum baldaniorum]|uniref:hypothetical protein n=1 Tax=Azospirillum baldaniorum TaxID=1064539 RepID=UPI0011A61557|nr:hypothetical protein [Azospirillum baldaniorum]TWA71927.1 hypothetical protein FBZ84_101193 [Azospirillum baldaniorum]
MSAAFDAEHVYDEKIAPLMKQIVRICHDNNLPMIASFLYQRSEAGAERVCFTHVHGSDERRSETFEAAAKLLDR